MYHAMLKAIGNPHSACSGTVHVHLHVHVHVHLYLHVHVHVTMEVAKPPWYLSSRTTIKMLLIDRANYYAHKFMVGPLTIRGQAS